MPGYGGTGSAVLLRQNNQTFLFQRESVSAGSASTAVQVERQRDLPPTGLAFQVYFTDVNGNPANPGSFEIDVQLSDIDQDSQYCTEASLNSGLNLNYAGRIELGVALAKYIRAFVKTLTNAVYVTVCATCSSSAGLLPSVSGGSGGGVTSLNALTGALSITAGTGIAVTPSGSSIQITNGGITSLNALTGALSITAGTGITVTPSGSSIQIASTGGGAPSGPAGGDLTGTYPNPTVAGIANATLPSTFSAPGAASTPGVKITGAPYTGGTATTNWPQLYLDSGTTEPTTWATAGTVFGINAPSGFIGNLCDFRVNGGALQFTVNQAGVVTLGSSGSVQAPSGYRVGSNFFIGTGGILLGSAYYMGWCPTVAVGTPDIAISRQAAGILQLNTASTSGNAGALSLAQILLNGGTAAASTSQFVCTTPPYTAGTGTTNAPVLYLDSGATEPTTWSTTGTIIGVNAPASFNGNVFDVHINGGGSIFSINGGGSISFGGNILRASANANGIVTANQIQATQSFTASTVPLVVTNSTATPTGSLATFTATSTIVASIGPKGQLQGGALQGLGSAPTTAAGAGAGTSPTITIAGSNIGGVINVTTGTAPSASSVVVTVTMANAVAFPTGAAVTLTPANAVTASLAAAANVFGVGSTTGFTINSNSTALAASTAYSWNFHIDGY